MRRAFCLGGGFWPLGDDQASAKFADCDVHAVPQLIPAGVDVIVAAGTSSEYGFKDHPPTEHEPVAPASSYAVAKASAES
mgnify:CR=1 FL=1